MKGIRNSKIWALSVVVFVFLAGTAQAVTITVENVLYVDKDAEGGNDGTSWADAYEHLQDALEVAENGNIILVAEGAYAPDSNSATPAGSGDRSATFQLISGVTIKGGYAGYGEPDPNARSVELYETILSGDLDSNDGEAAETEDLLDDPNRAENSYHVVTCSGTDTTAVLDGLSIKGGQANGPDPNDDRGGGLYNEDGSPTIINCTISGNSAQSISGSNGCGGGIYNYSNNVTDAMTLSDCVVAGNAVRGGNSSGNGNGAGIYSRDGNLELSNCTVCNNAARGGEESNTIGGNGGGLYKTGGDLTLINCAFSDNSAYGNGVGFTSGNGGGLYNSGGSATITDCSFTNNYARKGIGGGIHSLSSNPILSNCVFIDNSGGYGGGIYCSNSRPTISECDFLSNRAYFTNGYGGGMYNASHSHATLIDCYFIDNSAGYGGGVHNDNSDPSLANCEFIQNSATFTYGRGGGMCNYSSHPTLTNCLFFENSAPSSYGNGGGMCNYYSWPTLTGCTLSNNSSGKYGGGISILETSHPSLSNCILWGNSAPIGAGIYDEEFYTWITIEYSNVQGGCSWSCSNNINADPLFVTGLLGDYYLSQMASGQGSTSPCVDAGGDTAVNLGMDEFTTRTDQMADEGVVDMGYHYSMTGNPDIRKDGCVNFIDFAIAASQWLGAPGVPSADIAPYGGDGIVDTNDLGLLMDFWLYYMFAAGSPSPGYNEGGVNPNVVLNWSAGSGDEHHDVYFGTDFDDVNNADILSDEYKGNYDVTSYDPCGLDFGTIYYWRIDERNTCGTVKGAVWSFRTMEVSDLTAHSPNPADGAGSVHPNTVLSWSAGNLALSHDVYLGMNFDDANDANVASDAFMGNFAVPSYDPCGFDTGTTYYWRIDEKNTFGTAKGDVWSFTTMELSLFKASNPEPAGGATGVPQNTVLSWAAGYEALSHDVYIGTDFADVNDANTLSDEFKGNYDVNSYDPCGLDLETTYYWRIDERNTTLGIAKGNVWSFTTLNPVGWWEFEEGGGDIAYDSSGNGNDGTLVGQPEWVSGAIGGAVDCNGTGDYISIPSIAALGGSNVTIMAWINGDNFVTYSPVLTQYNLSYGGYYLYVRGSDNKPALYLSGVEVVSSSTISTGQWYHIVGTYDNSVLKIYINGDLKATSSANGFSGVEHNCYIGYDQTDDYYFDGVIDDVRVYDRALSAEEIELLYQAGL